MEESNGKIPGRGQAIASLVLGIISIVFVWFGYSTLVGLACGIVGVFMAAGAKKRGYTGGMRTAGFVCSLVGTILCALVFAACIACIACVAAGGIWSGAMDMPEFSGFYNEIYPYLAGVTAGLLL